MDEFSKHSLGISILFRFELNGRTETHENSARGSLYVVLVDEKEKNLIIFRQAFKKRGKKKKKVLLYKLHFSSVRVWNRTIDFRHPDEITRLRQVATF